MNMGVNEDDEANQRVGVIMLSADNQKREIKNTCS